MQAEEICAFQWDSLTEAGSGYVWFASRRRFQLRLIEAQRRLSKYVNMELVYTLLLQGKIKSRAEKELLSRLS